jgi:dihydroneopterin aldolase
VLELSLRESLQLGHNYIGTEHILLGLTKESEGVAARVLSNLDVDPDKVRREVVRMLGGGRGGPEAAVWAEGVSMALAAGAFATFPDAVFRVKVEGLEVRAAYGATEEKRSRPRGLLVNLEYSYDEARHPEGAETLDPETVIGGVAGVLAERPLTSLPEAVKRVGGYVLETFPEVTEAAVTVTDDYENADVAVSGVSVARVFGRSLT